MGTVQFLQQFLSIHETYQVQQNQLVFQFFQQQQQVLASGSHSSRANMTTPMHYPMNGGSSGRHILPNNGGAPSIGLVPSSFQMHGNPHLAAPSPLAGYSGYPTSSTAARAQQQHQQSQMKAGPDLNRNAFPRPQGYSSSMAGSDSSMLSRYPRFVPYTDIKQPPPLQQQQQQQQQHQQQPQSQRRRLGEESLPTVAPPPSAPPEAFTTVMIAKYLIFSRNEKSGNGASHMHGGHEVHLGIPAFSTFFPPIRLVSGYNEKIFDLLKCCSPYLNRLVSSKNRMPERIVLREGIPQTNGSSNRYRVSPSLMISK
jgi:hypothetical protein